MKDYFTTKEVCKLLDISRVTLQKYIKDGVITPSCKIKGKNMFLREDLINSEYVKGIKGFLLYLGVYKEFLEAQEQEEKK